MTKRIDDMIGAIQSMSGARSEYEVFSDWIHCLAISIQNQCCMIHDKIWKQRENDYLAIYNRYETNMFAELSGMLALELEETFSDVLSEIYMRGNMGSKSTGQFFTPFHISYMSAKLGFDKEAHDENGIYHMHEPSIGGGGMAIAIAKVMYEVGIDYRRKLKVVGQDLDWKAVYMSYVQLSLLGVDAVIVQGNTLAEPYHTGYPRERTFRTPINMGMIIRSWMLLMRLFPI